MAATTMYGALFMDVSGHYLFVDQLSAGYTCQAQLVYHCETGELAVRKVLHRRLLQGQENDANVDRREARTRPAAEFHNEVVIVPVLIAAAGGDVRLRIPKLLSNATIANEGSNKYSKVSFWSLCNGGTLHDFVEHCWDRGVSLHYGFVLRFLRQMLETLRVMYTKTGPGMPIFHGDLHPGNVMLHFPSHETMPDFYLIDFGQAGYARRYPYYQGDDLRVWDIPDLMNIIETKLFRLTLPIAGPGAVHHHEGLMALLNEQNTSNPICVAYQVLRRLDRQYAINKNLAVTQSRSTQQQPTRLVVPCLDGIINYVAAHATHAEPSLVASGNWRAFNQTYCSLYELGSCPPQPVRRPLLFPTAQELLAIRNIPGPWYVARVDVAVGQYDFRVRKVLDGAHHRPNEDNTDSDTEEAYMWSDEDESGGC